LFALSSSLFEGLRTAGCTLRS